MRSNHPNSRSRDQAGYTLLLVVFLVASMILVAAAAAPNVLTQGRREKEEEMIWRGQQYARAIGLYYRKFGKYPTKVEDLTNQTNGVRFLRHAYTDPMNKDDGSWRFIYVGPNGQLIGSLRQISLLQTALSSPGLSGSLMSGGGLQPLAPPGGQLGAGTGTNQSATGIGQPGQQQNNALSQNPLESQPQPFNGTILGGNIIGVGSKVKQPSLKVYLGGDTYQQWEFIWNPTGLAAVPGQAPVNPNLNPTAAPNSANPNGTAPATTDGQQPQQTPQTPNVNVPAPPSPTQ